MIYRVLYNPLAGNGHCEEAIKVLNTFYDENRLKYYDMTKIDNYRELLESLPEEDKVIICGGDGTLNRFVNDTDGIEIKNDILYFAVGSGNDLLRDVKTSDSKRPFSISKYLKNLPTVTVNGKTYKFINNVGFGIDGYCCEEGDKLRKASDKPVNYEKIAIRGLLGGFQPVNAEVVVDGVISTFKNVWLAPTMNGRYYGGGMMPTPKQDRMNNGHYVSLMVFHNAGKLKALCIFPSLFKGEHVKYKNQVSILTGRDITVKFDRPCALQYDGETVANVTSYHVVSPEWQKQN